jgi:hypothetical protein
MVAGPLQQLQQQHAALLPLLGPIPSWQPDEDPQAPLVLLRSLQSSGVLQQVVCFCGVCCWAAAAALGLQPPWLHQPGSAQ